jgi:phosphoglycolate phosphatase
MRAPKPVVVFDLDGTLADTAPDLGATLNVILAREGLPPVTIDRARTLIGHGARAMIAGGLEAAGREVTPDRLEELYRLFLAHYGDHLCVETRLFPGAAAAIDRLERAGFAFAVCTNKMELHSVRLIEALGLKHRFAAICGRDSFPYVKPDPRHLTLTIERAGGRPSSAVMVGDSLTDIVTARAARVPVVAVSFGYSGTPVHELKADRVVDSFDELAEAVLRIMRTKAAEPSATATL